MLNDKDQGDCAVYTAEKSASIYHHAIVLFGESRAIYWAHYMGP